MAIADDNSATHYNPAGLGFQSSFNSTLTYNNWLPGLYPGMYYGFLSSAISLDKLSATAQKGLSVLMRFISIKGR